MMRKYLPFTLLVAFACHAQAGQPSVTVAEEAIRITLPRLTPEQLAADYPEAVGGVRLRTDAYLLQVTVHLAYHLGQIDYHRRIVTGDATSVGAVATAELDIARPAES